MKYSKEIVSYDENPFQLSDSDRHELWEMLVRRDIDAFLAVDWPMIEGDFVHAGFFGIDGCKSIDTDKWKPTFPSVNAYRDEWLRQALDMQKVAVPGEVREALFKLTNLTQIDIDGDLALLHKKFDGTVPMADGSFEHLSWQTLYLCARNDGRWNIRGFFGYLPYPLVPKRQKGSAKIVPTSQQHATAGPFSPVLTIPPGVELVVISGQASLDLDGNVIGETIEDQARHTLKNCEDQLAAAGANFADVFKVNVYLTDIEDWARFNVVYKENIPAPLPVRTAVQAVLPVKGLLVEIEMWAARTADSK